jgi:hypothetical protein
MYLPDHFKWIPLRTLACFSRVFAAPKLRAHEIVLNNQQTNDSKYHFIARRFNYACSERAPKLSFTGLATAFKARRSVRNLSDRFVRMKFDKFEHKLV